MRQKSSLKKNNVKSSGGTAIQVSEWSQWVSNLIIVEIRASRKRQDL